MTCFVGKGWGVVPCGSGGTIGYQDLFRNSLYSIMYAFVISAQRGVGYKCYFSDVPWPRGPGPTTLGLSGFMQGGIGGYRICDIALNVRLPRSSLGAFYTYWARAIGVR